MLSTYPLPLDRAQRIRLQTLRFEVCRLRDYLLDTGETRPAWLAHYAHQVVSAREIPDESTYLQRMAIQHTLASRRRGTVSAVCKLRGPYQPRERGVAFPGLRLYNVKHAAPNGVAFEVLIDPDFAEVEYSHYKTGDLPDVDNVYGLQYQHDHQCSAALQLLASKVPTILNPRTDEQIGIANDLRNELASQRVYYIEHIPKLVQAPLPVVYTPGNTGYNSRATRIIHTVCNILGRSDSRERRELAEAIEQALVYEVHGDLELRLS